MSKVQAEDFNEAMADNLGWCSGCRQFTNSGVEPDAEGYECENCEKPTVYGAGTALIMDMFTIVGGEVEFDLLD